MSFINFNNKSELYEGKYSARVIAEALYSVETKNTKKIEATLSSVKEPVAISEALKFFSNKINALSALHVAKTNALPVNEGQFSWMTQDTGEQIGSEKENRITVYMYDNEGNQYKEDKYDGYGEFGGMDYYELLAKMNGYSEEDLEEVKGPFKEMRQLGIDLAFGKLKTKDKGRKVLFPALVEDPKFLWKRHNFTQEPESDPNQSWYVEPEYDEYESRVTEEYDVSGISRKDLKDILNYLYTKDISYSFDGPTEILDFDMTELDKKGQAELKKLGINESLVCNKSVTESAMSDIDILAQEAKDFKSFVKEFKKEYKNMDAGSAKELEAWLQSVYDSAKENMDEQFKVTEGREANRFGIESQHIGKLQDGKLSKYTEGNGMPFGLISRPETGLSDTDKNAVKDYVNADNIVLGFYPMEDSNNDTMYNAVKEGLSWDSLIEKINEEDLNERSINKIQKDWAKVTADMKDAVSAWKSAEGAEKEKMLAKLKELTAKKKGLEAELDSAVGLKDADAELVGESVDGYALNMLADGQLGMDPASEFLSKHNVDLNALKKAKIQKVISYYEIRDVVQGNARKSLEKEFFKNYVKESVVTEAKTLKRDDIIAWIEKYIEVVRTSEEFDGAHGGIWVSGENADTYKGKRIYDYYNEDPRKYSLGVLTAWEKELNKRGWYSEWYDAGTVMIWPN